MSEKKDEEKEFLDNLFALLLVAPFFLAGERMRNLIKAVLSKKETA